MSSAKSVVLYSSSQNVDDVTVQCGKDTSITLKFCDTKRVIGNRHVYILKYGEIEAYTGLHNDWHNYYGVLGHYGPYSEYLLDNYFEHYYEDMYTVTSLSPGTKYNFTLYSALNGVRSRGYQFTAETSKSYYKYLLQICQVPSSYNQVEYL